MTTDAEKDAELHRAGQAAQVAIEALTAYVTAHYGSESDAPDPELMRLLSAELRTSRVAVQLLNVEVQRVRAQRGRR